MRDALVANEREAAAGRVYWCMPVVMETYDGLLNDIWGQHVNAAHVQRALAAAQSGPVAEGGVGGGTGMICHEFKGGIGTASRVLAAELGGWTVGALVQANYGVREMLRVAGYPVGEVLRHVPSPFRAPDAQGEAGMEPIVVTIATDAAAAAPVHASRPARERRAGARRRRHRGFERRHLPGVRHGQRRPAGGELRQQGAPTTGVKMVNNDHISALFVAAAEAVEEAIVNALVAGGDVESRGARVEGLGAGALAGCVARGGLAAGARRLKHAPLQSKRRESGDAASGRAAARPRMQRGRCEPAVTTRRHAQLPK